MCHLGVGAAPARQDKKKTKRRNPTIMVFQTISYPSVSSTVRKNAAYVVRLCRDWKIGQSGYSASVRIYGKAAEWTGRARARAGPGTIKISVVYHNFVIGRSIEVDFAFSPVSSILPVASLPRLLRLPAGQTTGPRPNRERPRNCYPRHDDATTQALHCTGVFLPSFPPSLPPSLPPSHLDNLEIPK